MPDRGGRNKPCAATCFCFQLSKMCLLTASLHPSNRYIQLLGMVPDRMLEQSSDQHRLQFFEKQVLPGGMEEWNVRQVRTQTSSTSRSTSQQQPPPPKQAIIPSRDPVSSLTEVICSETHRKKKFPPTEARNTAHNYELFIDLIHRMLAYDPKERIRPGEALNHPFITDGDVAAPQQSAAVPYGAANPTRI